MLLAKLVVEVIFESLESSILMAGNGDCGRLVAARMNLDLVLERVVIDVICWRKLPVSWNRLHMPIGSCMN